MSKDPERVRSALQDADLTWLRDAVDASLTAVNLDYDADLQRILRVRSLGSYGVAVFKQESGVWWVLGSFVCGGPRNRMQDPFIELKPLISPGTSDIIVHSGGSQGTGVGAAQFTVYRVFKGQLQPMRRLKSTFETARLSFAAPERRAIKRPSPAKFTGVH